MKGDYPKNQDKDIDIFGEDIIQSTTEAKMNFSFFCM